MTVAMIYRCDDAAQSDGAVASGIYVAIFQEDGVLRATGCHKEHHGDWTLHAIRLAETPEEIVAAIMPGELPIKVAMVDLDATQETAFLQSFASKFGAYAGPCDMKFMGLPHGAFRKEIRTH